MSEQSADDVLAFSRCLDEPGVYSTDLIGRAATFADAADEKHVLGKALLLATVQACRSILVHNYALDPAAEPTPFFFFNKVQQLAQEVNISGSLESSLRQWLLVEPRPAQQI